MGVRIFITEENRVMFGGEEEYIKIYIKGRQLRCLERDLGAWFMGIVAQASCSFKEPDSYSSLLGKWSTLKAELCAI